MNRLRLLTLKTWERFCDNAQAAIALVGLLFTLAFSLAQQRVANSNLELAKTNIKAALIPSTSSTDPKQRILLLSLSSNLDPLFAVEVGALLANKDQDKDVRDTARRTLDLLARHPRLDVRQAATRETTRIECRTKLLLDLSGKQLLAKITDANDYLEGEAEKGPELAVTLYREVESALTDASRQCLSGLDHAREQLLAGNTDQAAKDYHGLFADYGHSDHDVPNGHGPSDKD